MYSFSDFQFQEPRNIQSAPTLLRGPPRSLQSIQSKNKLKHDFVIALGTLRSRSREDTRPQYLQSKNRNITSAYANKHDSCNSRPQSVVCESTIDSVTADLVAMQLNEMDRLIKPTSAGTNMTASTASTSAAINLYEAVTLAGSDRRSKKIILSSFDRPKSRKLYALDCTVANVSDGDTFVLPDNTHLGVLTASNPTPLSTPTSVIQNRPPETAIDLVRQEVIAGLGVTEASVNAEDGGSTSNLRATPTAGLIKRRTPRSLSGTDTQANGRPPSRQNSAFSFHLADDANNTGPGSAAVKAEVDDALQKMNQYFLMRHCAGTEDDSKAAQSPLVVSTDAPVEHETNTDVHNHEQEVEEEEDENDIQAIRPPSRQKLGAQHLFESTQRAAPIALLSTHRSFTAPLLLSSHIKKVASNNEADSTQALAADCVEGAVGRQVQQHTRPSTAARGQSSLPTVRAAHNYTKGTSSWAAAREGRTLRRTTHTAPSTQTRAHGRLVEQARARAVESSSGGRFAVLPWSSAVSSTTSNVKQRKKVNAGDGIVIDLPGRQLSPAAVCDALDSESVLSDVSEEALTAERGLGDRACSSPRYVRAGAAQEWLSEETDAPQCGIEASASVLTLDSNLDEAFLQLFST